MEMPLGTVGGIVSGPLPPSLRVQPVTKKTVKKRMNRTARFFSRNTITSSPYPAAMRRSSRNAAGGDGLRAYCAS